MLGNYTQYLGSLAAIRHPATNPEPVTNPGVTSGWESRSGDSAFKRFVVFAVGGIMEGKQFNAWALGEGLRFKALEGSWRGQKEPSFIVEDTNENRLRIAYWTKGQEAILCLGKAYRTGPDGLGRLFGNREAILDFLDGDGYSVTRREPAGLWQPASRNQALAQESWTFDPTENQYYIVV